MDEITDEMIMALESEAGEHGGSNPQRARDGR